MRDMTDGPRDRSVGLATLVPPYNFAAAPPGRITGRTRAFIRQMIASGRMYGIWREQELAGQRMAK